MTPTAATNLRALAAVALAAALFLLPALYNRYPIVFSDTGGFLEQALLPDIGWDKPWIYGPFLTPFHARLTLWPAAYAQCLLLSATLWLTQATLAPPRPGRHLLLCALLAATTAAPWFASLLMPDILAPIAALGLYVLAASRRSPFGPATRLAVAVVTTIAIASHLAHLVVAAACIALLALFDLRSLSRTAPPLAAALALLLVSNLVGNGRLAISPFGADFALARLVADGPARQTIEDSCPAAGWRLCAWRGRLPTDADDFLWNPYGPVWADGFGPTRLAPEAAEIVRATLRAHPLPALAAALRNTATQLVTASLGDTLVADHLEIALLPRIALFFPESEQARLTASRQYAGTLSAAPLRTPQAAILVAAALGTLLVLVRSPALRPLAALVLIALLANAFATGALSGPHDRYQARIAWLLLLPPCLAAAVRPRAQPPPRPATAGNSAG